MNGQCKYNEGVECYFEECAHCGWNPQEWELRKQYIHNAELNVRDSGITYVNLVQMCKAVRA